MPVMNLMKGIRHRTGASGGLIDIDWTSLLAAIAGSRAWVDTLLSDPNETFESIAIREGCSARYIELLAHPAKRPHASSSLWLTADPSRN